MHGYILESHVAGSCFYIPIGTQVTIFVTLSKTYNLAIIILNGLATYTTSPANKDSSP